ncbi:hypothetical protein COEREDRAFT_82833 [Coemansia reversa NRRL 1564]|uniref:Maintenance of telomere capping protein 1 n=1 Tax=Coemansia reversa (strain ATCC 12441 / NRRL 1564) TaxID=763665 RepID=A0A2G5B5P0_COERN|nr:hypothetical protein COEREDRAFT_82833 [Coemansia reversa NRRL 1564]|eukprot:PIA14312.1 hypothetical protein COEREDRAFT_82833 [Coemansia reversa NRRL 1564]
MSSKPNSEADSKKKARDDALQFLETLEINDEENAQGDEVPKPKDAVSADSASKGDTSSTSENKDAKGMLRFIDDLTESAKRSTSPSAGEDAGADKDTQATTDLSQSKQTDAGSGGWSWGGIWGQAAALVEHNAQLKSGLGRLKDSLEHVRNTDTSRNIESRMRTLVNQENISKFGGEFKRSLDTVIDTIAPPIQEHEVFNVHLVSSFSDANVESVVYRTMDAVFDFHECGAINVKSVSAALSETPEMQTRRGDTFTLPKGFDGGYGAAVTAVQFVQNMVKAQVAEASKREQAQRAESGTEDVAEARHSSSSPLFYRAHKTELVLAIQPFSTIPIEDQDFLSLCVVLRDQSRDLTLRTFSQMLPLSCWAQPHDQIVAVDVDASLGTAVNMRADSAVQRKQQMNEECLYEAVMLAVKSLANEYLATRRPAATEEGARTS